MPSQNETAIFDTSKRILTIIWVAFMAACGIYVLLGYYATQNSTQGEPPQMPVPMHLVFGALALVEIAVVFLAPRFLLSEDRLKAAIERGPTADQLTRTKLSDPDSRELSLLALMNQYQTAMIVIWAVAESIAIYGLILTFMLRSTTWLIPFAAVSLVLIALNPPRAQQFVEEHRILLR